MLYTFDTNFVSQVLNNNQIALSNVRNAIRDGHDVMLNAVCYYEIKRGLHLPTFQRKDRAFAQLVQDFGMLHLDIAALDEAADIYQVLRRQGQPIEDADLLMSAIARANGATLVTNNTRHFQRVANLQLVDWQ